MIGNISRWLIAVTLFALLCSAAIAGPKEEAFQVVEKWTKAFTESDVDGNLRISPSFN
jgi:hypothetical protein